MRSSWIFWVIPHIPEEKTAGEKEVMTGGSHKPRNASSHWTTRGAAQDGSLDTQPQNHMIINTQSVMFSGHRKGTQSLPKATTGASEVNE